MKRRLFLLSGSASAASLALTACGGGGGGADVASAGTTPVVVSSVATQPTAFEGLPARILGCYFMGWDTTYRITDVPADFNVIYLFNAQNEGNNAGDGSWTWPFANEVPAAQIQQVRQRGQKVILTIGGAGLGFAYTNRAQSTNCVNSVKAIISQIGGVDGLDFNNFEASILNGGNVSAVSTEMIWIAQQMRAAYGPDFAITMPPGGAGLTIPHSRTVAKAMLDNGLLSYAGPQFYDWNDYKIPGHVATYTDQWCQLLGANNVTVGLSADYDFANSLTLAECQREMSSVLAAHPDIRGVFCWSAQNNLNGGNAWGSTMKAALA